MRKVILYPGESGYIVAECPSLPGCISQGKNRKNALENIKEAISLYISTLIEDGKVVPQDHVELVEVV
ncbi:MAG: type II toxin-antitoxin system HicB family antitoxin [Thiomargarita sp.]|nr:type II toxin-antitoxin system HicB family antitoxin [Thiomargarita sp.]